MEFFDRRLDRRIGVGRSQTGGIEQILAVDDHLGPAVHRNRSRHAAEIGHGDSTGREGAHTQLLDDFVIGLDIQDAGFRPGQHILQCVVDHIGQILGGKRGGGAGAKVFFGDRDHLDGVAGLGFELSSDLLLFGQTVGLFLCGPETDRFRLRHGYQACRNQQTGG